MGAINDYIDKRMAERRDQLFTVAQTLWENPELSFEEKMSSEYLIQILENNGFTVETSVGGIPTAFMAKYGKESPTIGILGEYDALPGLSQQLMAKQAPIQAGKPGHGCGHNLLAAGTLGAALVIRDLLVKGLIEGTVIYYGCPAEEVLTGKVFMAHHGVFDRLDAALSWHPGDLTWARGDSTYALDSIAFEFTGTAAHTGTPQSGRSALDAMQLMNIGAELMRQYIPDEARISYSILNGGNSPGVVPETTLVWYYVRALKREQVEKITNWLKEVAEGAATMSQTSVQSETITSTYSVLHNQTIAETIYKNLSTVGPIKYSNGDRKLANNIQKTIPKSTIRRHIKGETHGLTEECRTQITEQALFTEPLKTFNEARTPNSSTDIGNVSRIVPLGRLRAAVWPVGTSPHTWQAVAASGDFGKKGTAVIANVLGRTAADLFTDTELLEKVWDEFEAEISGKSYQSPLPDNKKYPTHMPVDTLQ